MGGIFGWSLPPGCTGTPYDDEPQCPTCGGYPDGEPLCSCPECEACGCVGDPNCYEECGMPLPENTIEGFCNHIGIAPLSRALRAIDRHNLEHVWLVLMDGRRLYYHNPSCEELDAIPEHTLIRSVGAGCIAWDGSDWEFSSERVLETWADVDAVRQDCNDAYDEYHAEFGEE